MKRIAVIGDLQYEKGPELMREAFAEINGLSPDVVILLGDYGRHKDYGTAEGIAEIAEAAKVFGDATVCPLVGNHDLQNESGINLYPHGTFETIMKRTFSLDNATNVLEFDDFRLFVISLEPLPTDDYMAEIPRRENYISKKTLEFIEQQLALRPGVPVMMFTHAPPICSGLKTVPDVHVRYTNAYLNRYHNPEVFTKLIERYPQIAMWFCGHYHLGHHHDGSSRTQHGVTFFLTGVATQAGRDGTRHTRIIDIESSELRVQTFDHATKTLAVDVRCNSHAAGLATRRDEGAVYPVRWSAEHGKIIQTLHIGNDTAYFLTDTGFVWEVDTRLNYIRGTLNFSKVFVPANMHFSEGLIWISDGITERGFNPDNIRRYMVAYDEHAQFVERGVKRFFNEL